MNEEIITSKLRKKICRKAGVTIRDTKMIEAGDHILIGMSGGKDSMILAEVLADRKAALPFDFKITACHVTVESIGYKANTDRMQQICNKLNIDYIERSITIPEEGKEEKGICFLCSWHRRKALFEAGRELNCNKLALGHHRYDAIETLLINMIYHGSFSSMPYSLSMFDGRVKLIRPLLDMDENLLQDYARQRDFGTEGVSCEYEDKNRRMEIRKLIHDMELIHERASINIYRSMDKVIEEYLPQKKARTS
ncbi:MAG TPA: ATP-binding protein [Bacteroidales bacterium]|nr:ATP-binding protein [Bacteroidales bacterium]